MDPDIPQFPRPLVSASPGRLVPGAVGGLAAGVAFGVWMHAFGLMGDVADALRTDSLLVAWIAHLAIATLFGVAFAAIADVATLGAGLAWGAAWGVALFGLVGTLLLSALRFAMPQFDGPAQAFLAGHLMYGALLGAIYVTLRTKSALAETDPARYPTRERTS